MIPTFARHPFPTGHAEESIAVLQADAEELIEGLGKRSTRLGDALHTTLTLANGHCLLDPRAAAFPTWDAWVTAMQVSSAVYTATGSPGKPSGAASRTRTVRSLPPARSGT